VWSLGGLIAARARVGSARIVTVFNGAAAPGPEVTRNRSLDDSRAAGRLSADLVSLGLPEAVLRRHDGQPLYRSVLALRRGIAAGDPAPAAVSAALAPLLVDADVVFVPAAERSHVDHAIVREATLAAAPATANVYLYEDFPYGAANESLAGARELLDCLPDAWLAAANDYTGEIVRMFGDRRRFEAALGTFIATRAVRRESGWAFPVYRVNAAK
jgi:hypothetical protein